jgi:hypothetical protein
MRTKHSDVLELGTGEAEKMETEEPSFMNGINDIRLVRTLREKDIASKGKG